ncbi:MAG: RNA methyltransferase [Lachnospiraceae bacterium]|jgi:tRNA G18 (ribose-2'-O)-methylase SpoU|nr:RNA methyltransferase [Lachnospiraceae bacterium]
MNLHFIPISDLKDDNVSIYSQYKENQLVHYNEPELGLFIAESPKVIFRALDAGYEPVSFLVEDKTIESRETSELWEKLREMTSQEDFWIPVYVGDMKLLSQITGFKLTRGVLSAMKRKKLPDAKELCKDFRRIAVLENVVNPTNVGAIFRSAAALNIDAVLLTSGCSDPLYRRAARVSMGTVFQIPWTYISSDGTNQFWPERGMKLLKSMGFKTAAMALRDRSVSIDHPELIKEPKLAVILGTEGEGLMNETIETSDYVVKIPMSHGVDSLNVAAASAVVFWQLGQKGMQGF